MPISLNLCPELEHFETVKAAITGKLNEPVHHELSLRLRATRSIRVGLWCQPKIADRERLIASKLGVMVVIHLFNTAD